MKDNDLLILQELRKNARKSLTDIGNETNTPLSTVFKKVIKLEKNLIQKYVTLIDFNATGNGIRINLTLKSKDKVALKEHLMSHPNVNSLYRISQNFDFLVETIFPSMLKFEDFIESINDLICDKKMFHIIDDLKREEFVFIEDDKDRS